MSQAILFELNDEIRRLYIAGSDLASGDYRLKRLVPALQQLGERAPVFKKLAEGTASLIAEDSGADSARRLQDVNLLLQSVLRTQGKGSAAGETVMLHNKPVSLKTFASFRKLSAVRHALTTRGGGRHEIIVEAFRDGLFQDLRLLPFALEALNDPYAEIAEFAMTDILPSYGAEIVPHLIRSFEPAGGKLEARKLTVIARSGGEQARPVIYEAAVSGSDEVRTTAIRLLAGYAEYEGALLEFSRDKKKSIREAAYQALADSDSASAAERLYEASKGKDSELVGPALNRSRSERLNGWLARDFAKLIQSVEAGVADREKTQESSMLARRYFWALHHKTMPELEEIYLRVLRNYTHYAYTLGWTFLTNAALQYITKTGSGEGRELVRAAIKIELKKTAGTNTYVRETFVKAQSALPPEHLYEEYAGILQDRLAASSVSKSANYCKHLLDTLEGLVIDRRYREAEPVWTSERRSYAYYVEMPSPEQIAAAWDPRWLDHFIALNHLALVSAFARPGHEAAASYLLAKLGKSPEFRNRFANLAAMGLVRAGIPEKELHEALIRALEDERNTECHEIEPFLFDQLCRLPASYADRIRKAMPKFVGSSVEQLGYILKTMESSI
ncbi:MAG: HEAT repeat domain-containing protein [Paenibacillus macerans]|uniref:HEAT repeat domain-containing protein n=1 Tax=Paenibacillus TaxID=44249 RepID=UPI001F0F865A|nr:HEAT repeat domain-containing protein [Paenibacillus macerans]MDU7475652.1 HEAT repeat domain-containing protein [Paenibacillus macerans]MEC0140129.1 HEAT repeat domain-containing protein [Paenibacillus macerans]UMV46045.1 HEAT repeat domain-containing protein [Paenibacillus macerans]